MYKFMNHSVIKRCSRPNSVTNKTIKSSRFQTMDVFRGRAGTVFLSFCVRPIKIFLNQMLDFWVDPGLKYGSLNFDQKALTDTGQSVISRLLWDLDRLYIYIYIYI